MERDRVALPAMARFLDRMRPAPGGAALAAREHDLLELFPGARVLDVGCGTGHDAQAFAAAVGDHGTVIAVDSSAEMLQVARTRAAAIGARIRFVHGDAAALELDDSTVDRAFSSRLLHQSTTPDRIVAEMVRVTVRGGRLVLSMEPDWDTLVVDVPESRAHPTHRGSP